MPYAVVSKPSGNLVKVLEQLIPSIHSSTTSFGRLSEAASASARKSSELQDQIEDVVLFLSLTRSNGALGIVGETVVDIWLV